MLGPIEYECVVGLWLNKERTETRRAASVLRAISAAISNAIPKDFFEAVSESPEEGEAEFQAHGARNA